MTKITGKRYCYKFDFHGLTLACQPLFGCSSNLLNYNNQGSNYSNFVNNFTNNQSNISSLNSHSFNNHTHNQTHHSDLHTTNLDQNNNQNFNTLHYQNLSNVNTRSTYLPVQTFEAKNVHQTENTINSSMNKLISLKTPTSNQPDRLIYNAPVLHQAGDCSAANRNHLMKSNYWSIYTSSTLGQNSNSFTTLSS